MTNADGHADGSFTSFRMTIESPSLRGGQRPTWQSSETPIMPAAPDCFVAPLLAMTGFFLNAPTETSEFPASFPTFPSP